MSADNARKVCKELNVNTEWLLTGRGPMRPGEGSAASDLSPAQPSDSGAEVAPSERGASKVPVISWVKAGEWCESPDSFQPGDADEWISCPFEHSSCAFCLIVIGDSMFPEYREGEYILVDPEVEPRHNDDVVVREPEGRYTFKRLQITPDGTYLLALNPDHPERKIRIPADAHICGVVTGSWTRRRRKL